MQLEYVSHINHYSMSRRLPVRHIRPLLIGLCSAAALYAAPVSAQEFALFGGSLWGGGCHFYAWAFDYQEGLSPHAAIGS
ncbi:hypothetical protein WJ64_20505 [Burkholderia ubonensis]|nr:hypothetical protein WJ64_20505 [Burkholderia ubonensis]